MGGALGGVDPVIIGIGPVENTRKLLNRPNMTMADIDIEGNEAFAAQSIVVKHELRIPYEKLSVNGGRVGFNG